jgi:hypothetical protein
VVAQLFEHHVAHREQPPPSNHSHCPVPPSATPAEARRPLRILIGRHSVPTQVALQPSSARYLNGVRVHSEHWPRGLRRTHERRGHSNGVRNSSAATSGTSSLGACELHLWAYLQTGRQNRCQWRVGTKALPHVLHQCVRTHSAGRSGVWTGWGMTYCTVMSPAASRRSNSGASAPSAAIRTHCGNPGKS